MRVDLFDFELPEDRIATRPVTPRDAARLLLVRGQETELALSGVPYENQEIFMGIKKINQSQGGGVQSSDKALLSDRIVNELPDILKSGDLLVLNNTKVIPARLIGKRGNATIEVTLVKKRGQETEPALSSRSDSPCERQNVAERGEHNAWLCFAKPAKRLRIGEIFHIADDFSAIVEDKLDSGEVVLSFNMSEAEFFGKLEKYGSMPLPPYMRRKGDAADNSSYQTIFAKEQGAVAAPTAGLHFTPELLAALKEKGIETVEVTLHVGAGTFLPVKVEDTQDHHMHSERIIVTREQADKMNAVKAAGGRIVAIGTTALRVLESVTDSNGQVQPFSGETDIFITPGYTFRCVDILLTNFHLPRSTLFMLVCAFAGQEAMHAAYRHAIDRHYRFYSYGDACLLFKKR